MAGIDIDDYDFDIEQLGNDANLKWYMLRRGSTAMQIWEMLQNCLTIYSLFVTPFLYQRFQTYTIESFSPSLMTL